MVLDDVKRIVSEQLGIDEDEISEESMFAEDLGADSLDLVDFVLAFESEFDIEIPEEDVEAILTVKDAVEYIKERTDME